MIQRSIILLPQFTNIEKIEQWRQRYDPLVEKTAPHITLVFPFESTLSSEKLGQHMEQAVAGISPFELTLHGVTGTLDQYLFLNVKKGNDQIIELHDRLYSDLLSQYLYRKVTYLPHLTIGKFSNSTAFETALLETEENTESFDTIVEKIYLEQIDAEENSQIELVISLGG